MNVKTTKLNFSLYLPSLKARFVTVEDLKRAISDGTLENMFKECAEELYAGDVKPVVDQFKRSLASKKTNMKKAVAVAPEHRDDKVRVEILWDYAESYSTNLKPTVANLPVETKAKARWQLTISEIELIPADDIDTLQSIYDNMASKLSKYPEAIEKEIGMEEYRLRYKFVSERLNAAKTAAKAARLVGSKVSDDIAAKLKAGKKLTAEEADQLLKLLSR